MGEKKRRQSAQQAGQSRDDGKLIAQAFAALKRGDRSAAASAFEALQAALPRDAEALHAAGVLGLQLGDSARAAELLARSVQIDPRDPACRCHLAIAYRRLDKPDLAIDQLGIALQLDPTLAEAHSNLGNLLRERGDSEAALQRFERALAIRRDFPEALNGLGEVMLALGHYAEACANCERALALDPGFHEARYTLARARTGWAASLERVSDAAAPPPAAVLQAELGLESILAALQLARDIPEYWTQFEVCVRNFDLRHPVDPRVRETLMQALDHPAVEPARLARPIVSLAITRPGVPEIQQQLDSVASFDALAWTTIQPAVLGFLGDPLLQRLLRDIVVPNAFVERLIATSRRALLREIAAGPSAKPSLPLSIVIAMAHQCFNTEYVCLEFADECAEVAALRKSIADAHTSGNSVPLHRYAVYACYRSLHTLDAAEQIGAGLMATELRSLAIRQIAEPLEEARVRPTIAALTAVTEGVSVAVQDQYEANPYPRWIRIGRGIAPTSVAEFFRRRFPDADLDGLATAPARILVAGCGTGQHSVGTAQRFADSTVLAVDLSLKSLAYAQRKTRELSIGNIQYRQADILALGSLTERFDVIECVGVLHHLADPVAGWRILCSLLRPDGAMRIGLYSEIARRHVIRAREFAAAEGFGPTPDGIRAFRTALLARSDDALLARVARGEDFYSLSGCRDLVFHVQEKRYALPQIARHLADLGLRFIGFELPDAGTAASYRARFPDDPELTNLDHWHEFETAKPDTFALMYQFWVRKQH